MIIHNNGIIKYQAEDFKVTEKVILPYSKSKIYSLFLLKKKQVSLFNCLMRLSKIIKIPIANFQFFGEKDKYAVTKQLIYTPKLNYIQNEVKTKDFEFIYLFDIGDINPNCMIGNKFQILVRKIKDIETIKERIEKIEKGEILVPNYYDIQRFGKRMINHIIGYYLLNSKYFEASYLFLSAYSKNENHKVKKIRKKLKELFDNQSFNIDQASKIKLPQYMDIEKIFLTILLKKRSFKRTWKDFPHKFTSLFKEAFFSYKFNSELKKIIQQSGIKYCQKIYELTIPEEFQNLTNKFDNKIELLYPLEKISKYDNETNKHYKRKFFILPKIYNYEFSKDEIFPNHSKMKIEFFLEKGCFATNILNFLLC